MGGNHWLREVLCTVGRDTGLEALLHASSGRPLVRTLEGAFQEFATNPARLDYLFVDGWLFDAKSRPPG